MAPGGLPGARHVTYVPGQTGPTKGPFMTFTAPNTFAFMAPSSPTYETEYLMTALV